MELYTVNIAMVSEDTTLKLSLYSFNRLFFAYSNFYNLKWLIKNFNWSVKYNPSLFLISVKKRSKIFHYHFQISKFSTTKTIQTILFHNGHMSRNNTVNATHFTLFRSSFTRVRHFVTQWKPAVSPVNYPTVRGLREIDALLNNFRCLADAWYIEYVMRGYEWSNDVSFLTGISAKVSIFCFLFFVFFFFPVLWHLFFSLSLTKKFWAKDAHDFE